MGLLKGHKILLSSLFFFFCSGAALAVPIGYTDYNAFLADLPGSATTLDFDSLAAETIIADGDTVDGITFNYDFGGVQMMVSDIWDTTSSQNFLGTNDGDIFQGGDGFDLTFAPSNSIGMYFISAEEPEFDILDDDITLSAGGLSVELDVSEYDTLADGSYAFFLGIIDVENLFTTANITSYTDPDGPYFLYNVDDITTAAAAPVPEPITLVLLGTGLGLFSGGALWKRRRKNHV